MQATTAQGVGWVVVGFGIVLAMYGIAADVEEIRTLVPDSAAIARVAPRPKATSRERLVCSDCGGDLTENAAVCPHCGARIEGE